ncbi:hypothetical protein PUN28_020872 [Cardiocondyla obscurior]|uniref:Uncharacterized protein n=1 Tax=Cardiocondyla obscurior TaxID=286306 RepID=A0AAW2E5D0_9HYME
MAPRAAPRAPLPPSIMGKHSHKSRKRRHSSSESRLNDIEEKIARIMDFMTRVADEVSSSRRSPSVSSGSHVSVQEAGMEQPAASTVIVPQAGASECSVTPAPPQGVYRHAGSAFAKCRRHNVALFSPSHLFFRISLHRRAQFTSVLNLVAKSTADALPADNFLFGSTFGEEIKKASSMQKCSKDIVRAAPSFSRKPLQSLQTSQTPSAKSGNSRAPPRSSRTTPRKPGAQNVRQKTTHRSRSRSRRRH